MSKAIEIDPDAIEEARDNAEEALLMNDTLAAYEHLREIEHALAPSEVSADE